MRSKAIMSPSQPEKGHGHHSSCPLRSRHGRHGRGRPLELFPSRSLMLSLTALPDVWCCFCQTGRLRGSGRAQSVNRFGGGTRRDGDCNFK